MITWQDIGQIHIDSFSRLPEELKAAYLCKIVASWTFRDKAGKLVPPGDLDSLDDYQQAQLILAFTDRFIEDITVRDEPAERKKRTAKN